MANQIKVVLKQDVDTLGHGGDVVRVRPGYARNYLLPRGMAMAASAGNLARLDELKKAAQVAAARQMDEAKKQASVLESVHVKIERSVGDEGRMFGSVTGRDIEEAFASAGHVIDRKKLQLSEPIKALGPATVVLKILPSVSTSLKVEVIKKS